MKEEIKAYLSHICSILKIDPKFKKEIVKEIYTHLEEKIEELCCQGLEEKEAIKAAIRSFGQPQFLGKWIYEAYNQGDWGEALLAALPHILFASLFLFELWQSPGYFLLFFSFTLMVSLLAWSRDKPLWVFPWLGYTLLPLIGFCLFLPFYPPWSYLALAFYIFFGFRFLLYPTLVKAVERDWLYGTLMLLPYPLLFGWFLALRLEGISVGFSSPQLGEVIHWIALSFLALGLTVFAFIRLGENRLKLGILFTSQLLILFALGISIPLGFLPFIFFISLALILLLSPAFLRRKWERRYSFEVDESWLK